MNNQFLTFQAPISVKILEFIGQTKRHIIRTQVIQLTAIISTIPNTVHQSFHRTQYLLHPVLGVFIYSSFQRHPMCRFIGFPCNSLQIHPCIGHNQI
ncbi:hypothetical protein ES332_D02G094800v1 [Gossypium tomentosum]|uniref:Uncharacterized protein n=1 Tax=Gossypium tomentosum TaxID=34277 RepID=A0A5D2LV26_GOSTO|nr:hypothetical protein ES332_D02G094800v1 [Gossypium tomentosum]